MLGNLIIFSAPSGSGKTTIVHELLQRYGSKFEFSISATTRAPRGQEVHGVDYYFLSQDEFRDRAASGDFVEWEMVYPGCYYGTLRSELVRIWADGKIVLFDVDVRGGVKLKQEFGPQALSIFVQAPSLEILKQRLKARSTDSSESIDMRIQKATEEMRSAKFFDVILVNDDLRTAVDNTVRVIRGFIGEF